jgi:WD40 repeat protein
MLCVKFSPDSKLLAISDGNPEVRHDVEFRSSVVLWDVATRTEVRKLEGHTSSIFTLAFSPDGKTLASGSMDQTVKLWDVANGALRETIVPGETGTSLGIGIASEAAAKPAANQADPRSGHWFRWRDNSSLLPADVLPHGTAGNTDAGGETPGASTRPGAAHPARSRALVWSLAYSPDGRRLAIGQQGLDEKKSVLRIWDLAAKRDVIWMARPSGYRCVAFSRDGKGLASGTFDCVVEMYRLNGDVATMDHLWSDLGEPINVLAFLPGDRIAIGDWAGETIYLRPREQSQVVARYPGRIFALAASPDGSILAVGGEPGEIQLYEVDSGQCRATMFGHDLAVESLDFSPDGKHLASTSWDKTIRIWDVQTGREVRRIAHSGDERLAVRFSPDGKTLACAGGRPANPRNEPMPCPVQLWDWAEGTLLHVLSGHTNSIYALAFSPDGKTLASGSLDQTVKFWDVATGALRETIVPGETGTSVGIDQSTSGGPQSATVPIPGAILTGAENQVVSLERPEAILPHGDKVQAWSAAYSPDGKRLITAGSSGVLVRWDVDKIPGGARLLSGLFSPVRSIAFSPDGKLFATGAKNHTLGLWDADGDPLALWNAHDDEVCSVAFSPDGKRLASGSDDKTAKVWDVVTRKLICTIAAQRDRVKSVAFSPDGKFLATGCGDWQTKMPGEVRLWDADTGNLLFPVLNTRRDVKALAFSPDGIRLAVACGSEEGSVAVVSLSVGSHQSTVGPVTRLDCPTGATALAFSADGKTLAAGQGNGKLRLWDGVTLAPLVKEPVPAHGEMIFDLSFAPDGKHLATASKDGTVKIWSLDSLKRAYPELSDTLKR